MRIFDNFLYKVVALLVAALLWAAAQGVRDVQQSIDLPVQIESRPEALLVIDQSALDVNVRLQGSRAALRRAQEELTHYPVSLRGATEGDWNVDVSTAALRVPRGAEALAHSPAKISFQLERIESKSLPVEAELDGELPTDFTLRGVELEPRRVPVSGARTAVRRLREVRTEGIDLSGLRETTTLERRILMGVPNVWIEGEDATVVRVTLLVDPPPEPEPEAEDGDNGGAEEATQP